MKLRILFAAMIVSVAASAQTEADPIVMTVNGQPVDGNVIPFSPEEKEYTVEAVMG